MKALDLVLERTTREMILNYACRMLHAQHQTKGFMIDIQITDPHSQQEILVDTTCVHPTYQSQIRSKLKNIYCKNPKQTITVKRSLVKPP